MKIFITADYEGVSGLVQWNSVGEREAIEIFNMAQFYGGSVK